MAGPKLKTADGRMVCRDCGRTLDVFWRDTRECGDTLDVSQGSWEGRDPRVRRPVGLVPRHELLGIIPDGVLADPAMVVYRCHRKCGRLVLLDMYDVWRRCEETEGDRFEV